MVYYSYVTISALLNNKSFRLQHHTVILKKQNLGREKPTHSLEHVICLLQNSIVV